uniref:DDE_Tnp_1_7 domain-containing protein n=1 Tax=Ascaris lumbricoides TaxID=6252 RepID=A0A0M3IRD5_ASCLU
MKFSYKDIIGEHYHLQQTVVAYRIQFQRWNTIRLEDVLRYLRLSMRHQFRELFTRTVVIIANVHYSTFVRDYNSNSTGEQLEIYKELKDSSVPVDGNVLRKIESTYHSGRHTKRILRCKKSDYCDR